MKNIFLNKLNWYTIYFAFYRIGRKLDSIFNQVFKNRKKKNLVFYPTVQEVEDLSYLVNSIAASFPDRPQGELEIVVFAQNDLIDLNIDDIPTLEFQGDFKKKYSLKHLRIVKHSLTCLINSDAIMLWDINSLKNIFPLFYKTHIFDPVNLIYPTQQKGIAGWNYASFFSKIISQKENENFTTISKQNYTAFLNKKKVTDGKAYVFASGPSFQNYKNFTYEKSSYKISLNDSIRDFEFIQYVDLDAVCFKDANHWYGASKYAFDYFDKLVENHKKHPFYIFIRQETLPLLYYRHKEIRKYIIGINFKKLDNYYPLTLDEMCLSSYPSGNSLSSLAMPVALSIADELYLLGVDGYSDDSGKELFSYSKGLDIHNKRQTVHRNYPGYFNCRLEEFEKVKLDGNKYDRYIELFIKKFESHGKKVYTLCPSNYHSLKGCLARNNT